MAWAEVEAQNWGFGPQAGYSADDALAALAAQRQRLDRALASPTTNVFPFVAWQRDVEAAESSLAGCAMRAAPFLCAAALGGAVLCGHETAEQALRLAAKPLERLRKRAAKRH